MRFPTPALATATLMLSLALSGCGSSDSDQAAVATTETPTTSTTVDPYAVPEVIDAAYVDKVLKGFWIKRDQVTQRVAATGSFTNEDESELRSIYFGQIADRQVDIFQKASMQLQPESLRTEFTKVELKEVVAATPSCLQANAQISGSAGSNLFAFVLTKSDANELGWAVSQGTFPDMLQPGQAC